MRAGRAGLLLLLLLLVSSLSAQEAPDVAAIDDPAVATVTALLLSERMLLQEAIERYVAMTRERPESAARLAQLQESLDEEIDKEAEALPDRLDQLVEIASRAGADLDRKLADELQTVRQIGEHVRRIRLLEQQLATLEGRTESGETGALSGTWDLVLLPIDQKGSCVLEQSGAVVSGTYRLQGGYSGSLQGTLVNRKLYLVRIDSRLGKIMEFEAFVSADGDILRGTWLNYELAGAEGSTGHWTATRRAAR